VALFSEILQGVGHLEKSRLSEVPLLEWPRDLSEISGPQLHLHDLLCSKFPNQTLGEEAPSECDRA